MAGFADEQLFQVGLNPAICFSRIKYYLHIIKLAFTCLGDAKAFSLKSMTGRFIPKVMKPVFCFMGTTIKQQKVIIKKDDKNPEPTEIIAKAIIEVAEAAKKLNSSKLSRRAVVILIKDYIPFNISMKDIEAVLDAAASLDKAYIKP